MTSPHLPENTVDDVGDDLFEKSTLVQMKADVVYMNRRQVEYLTHHYEWSPKLQDVIDTIEAETRECEEFLGIKRCTYG